MTGQQPPGASQQPAAQAGQGVPPGTEVGPEDLPRTLEEWHLLVYYLLGTAAGWPKEKCERVAGHTWPLVYYKIHGIEMGSQWAVLGWLAARYARDIPTVAELADELWEVMEASPQDHRRPWRRSRAVDIAARAKRFTGREDAALRGLYDRAMAGWPLLRELSQQQPGRQSGHRQAGIRPARRPGVRA